MSAKAKEKSADPIQFLAKLPSVLPQYSLSTLSVLYQYYLSTHSAQSTHSLSTHPVLFQYYPAIPTHAAHPGNSWPYKSAATGAIATNNCCCRSGDLFLSMISGLNHDSHD